MDILVRQNWNLAADVSSAGMQGGTNASAIEVPLTAQYHVMYVDFSTLAPSNSLQFQAAIESSGPWFAETSTQLSTAISTRLGMRVSGPVGPLVRPFFGTVATGVYHVTYIAVG